MQKGMDRRAADLPVMRARLFGPVRCRLFIASSSEMEAGSPHLPVFDRPVVIDVVPNHAASDAGVPIVAAIFPIAAFPVANVGKARYELDGADVFVHFVTELPLYSDPQGGTVLNGQWFIV